MVEVEHYQVNSTPVLLVSLMKVARRILAAENKNNKRCKEMTAKKSARSVEIFRTPRGEKIATESIRGQTVWWKRSQVLRCRKIRNQTQTRTSSLRCHRVRSKKRGRQVKGRQEASRKVKHGKPVPPAICSSSLKGTVRLVNLQRSIGKERYTRLHVRHARPGRLRRWFVRDWDLDLGLGTG